MLKLPLMRKCDLNLYRNKKVLIYGFTKEGKEIHEILSSHGIKIIGYIQSQQRKFQRKAYHGIPLLTMEQLKKLAQQHTDLLVQCAFTEEEKIELMKVQLSSINIELSDVLSEQLILSFQYILYQKMLRGSVGYYKNKLCWTMGYRRKNNIELIGLKLRAPRNPIFICLPMKTADHTLYNTFDTINALDKESTRKVDINAIRGKNGLYYKGLKMVHYFLQIFNKNESKIEYANLVHRPIAFRKSFSKKYSTVRVITAVRDPISQNLSALYQNLITKDWILGLLNGHPKKARLEILNSLETLFLEQVDDADMRFQAFIERYIYPSSSGEIIADPIRAIQDFLPRFNHSVIDLYQYPFDKEVGYSIIRNGNTEVFVYQLEKLNDIVPYLSEWIGIPFETLEKGNVAEEKWLGENYKQAQKEICITQEYFDRCFNEAYMKHFYTDADIEKFKNKWRGHVN